MASTIKIKRGLKVNLPTLNDGEFALCTDTKEVFIGNSSNNIQLASSSQEVWTTPTFQNSWVNYGGTMEVAGYYKDNFGVVHLKGLVKSGTVGQAIFTLPVGYRPSLDMYVPNMSRNATADTASIVVIRSDGSVIASSSSGNVWLTLANISFKV